MKNLKKISITTIIIGLFIIPDYSCKYKEGHCFDLLPEDNLYFSFVLVDQDGNNIQQYYDTEKIMIYHFNYPDSLAEYRARMYGTDFYMRDETPYIGEHNRSFIIEWETDDIDTMRIVYDVSPIPEGECRHELISFECYFNDKYVYNNNGTYEFIRQTN